MFKLSSLPRILLNEVSRLAQSRNPSIAVVTRKGNVREVVSVKYNAAANTVYVTTR